MLITVSHACDWLNGLCAIWSPELLTGGFWILGVCIKVPWSFRDSLEEAGTPGMALGSQWPNGGLCG